MDNYINSWGQANDDMLNRYEQMYPDVYRDLFPHVQSVVDYIDDDMIRSLTDAQMNAMVDEVMASSQMQNMPHGHSNNSLRDFARLLLIRELLERGGYFRPPFIIVPSPPQWRPRPPRPNPRPPMPGPRPPQPGPRPPMPGPGGPRPGGPGQGPGGSRPGGPGQGPGDRR